MDSSYRWDYASLNVPLNEKGIEELDLGYDKVDVYHIRLSEEEANSLWKLFFALNEAFEILIDMAEEEILPFECLEKALCIAKSHLDTATDPIEKEATKKVIHAIEIAIKAKTYVEFSL